MIDVFDQSVDSLVRWESLAHFINSNHANLGHVSPALCSFIAACSNAN
ncbi:hypothetical protein ACT691_06695 [Vibrio metschnikovii]